jgi:hypothetical protein
MAFRKADESLVCCDKVDGFFEPVLLRSKRSETSESSFNE